MNILLKTVLLILGVGVGFASPLLAYENHNHGHKEEPSHKQDHDHDHGDDDHDDHEERTHVEISSELIEKIGVSSAIATEGVLQKRIKLYGTLVVDPLRLSHIQARYPGLIRKVNPSIGTRVKAGEVLATVESNESLREYPLLSPIEGTVVERHANAGEFSGEGVLFSILDERVLELHLQAFPADAHKIKVGQAIQVEADGQQVQTRIEFITPRIGNTPTLEVHAPVDNSAGLWVPNQAVEGWVTLAEIPVSLRVDNRALQEIENNSGVFVKEGNRYEFHPLTLGRSDGQFTEVLGGLDTGAEYALDNAYILKADLEKSGAAHEH